MSFSYITGSVIHYDHRNSVADILTASGLGYSVHVPMLAVGSSIELFTISSFDTNGVLQKTYGYLSAEDRDLHRAIVSIRGVGHVVANAIANSNGSLEALSRGDIDFLCSIRGLGRKGAENILAEYRKHPERFPAVSVTSDIQPCVMSSEKLSAMSKLVANISGEKDSSKIRNALNDIYNDGYRDGELIAETVRRLSQGS